MYIMRLKVSEPKCSNTLSNKLIKMGNNLSKLSKSLLSMSVFLEIVWAAESHLVEGLTLKYWLSLSVE